jgi:Aromatic-ring-opening dioxygenase LigAB, LigA subunit
MSVNAIEKILWQVHTNPAEAERFRADAAAYIADFNLDPDERRWLTTFDAGSMAEAGVSSMALMMWFQALRGPQHMGEYMQSLGEARARTMAARAGQAPGAQR